MSKTGFVTREKWNDYLNALANEFRVYVPARDGETIAFRIHDPARKPTFDRPATMSPKEVIFPQSETLFTFVFRKDADDPKKTSVELRPEVNIPRTILFCARPCDAKGFTVLDRVYHDADPYYRERREKTVIATLTCNEPYAACFCTSVNGGPADGGGSDVLITEVEKGYFLEALTDRGQDLLSKQGVEDGEAYRQEAQTRRTKALQAVEEACAVGKLGPLDAEQFHNEDFWDQTASKCVSCGACTYICPTCYCFNITDEQSFTSGERIRSWDSCMFPHFTLEASGHNPRTKKAARLKNRVGHKFIYYPEKYGTFACSGCGRCIRHCPVSVEISRIASALSGAGGSGKAEGAKELKGDGK